MGARAESSEKAWRFGTSDEGHERRQVRAVHTVLVVDDHEPYLTAMMGQLQHEHRRVVTASTSREAVRVAGQYRPELALVDLFMPGRNGIELVPELRRLDPHMFIILMSELLTPAYAMAAVRAGADDCLEKGLSAKRLLRRVELDQPIEPDPGLAISLDQSEWNHVTRALIDANGNRSQAAVRLGIRRQSLQRKLTKRLGTTQKR